jgi:hypothetical protein
MADTPLAPVVRHIHKLLRSAEAANEAEAHVLGQYFRQPG